MVYLLIYPCNEKIEEKNGGGGSLDGNEGSTCTASLSWPAADFFPFHALVPMLFVRCLVGTYIRNYLNLVH
jgi:hypothetical protein